MRISAVGGGTCLDRAPARRARRWAGPLRAGRTKENVVIQILGLILIGLVIGVLARLIVPGKQRLSMLATLLLGIAGAVIGGFLASLIGMGSITELNFVGFVLAVVAAVLLIGVAEGVSGRSRGSIR
jgi:uncharacterized membrane protein YeaQ/YmgE (transglycosylase-associated protein family)